jgi:hypothetical protein
MDEISEGLLLIVVGFFAGIINTLAGGGSLFTLPVLIFLGLPPSVANGTNRIAIVVQSLGGTLGYQSKKISTFPFPIYLGKCKCWCCNRGSDCTPIRRCNFQSNPSGHYVNSRIFDSVASKTSFFKSY